VAWAARGGCRVRARVSAGMAGVQRCYPEHRHLVRFDKTAADRSVPDKELPQPLYAVGVQSADDWFANSSRCRHPDRTIRRGVTGREAGVRTGSRDRRAGHSVVTAVAGACAAPTLHRTTSSVVISMSHTRKTRSTTTGNLAPSHGCESRMTVSRRRGVEPIFAPKSAESHWRGLRSAPEALRGQRFRRPA
jgi:hypothetical protein